MGELLLSVVHVCEHPVDGAVGIDDQVHLDLGQPGHGTVHPHGDPPASGRPNEKRILVLWQRGCGISVGCLEIRRRHHRMGLTALGIEWLTGVPISALRGRESERESPSTTKLVGRPWVRVHG